METCPNLPDPTATPQAYHFGRNSSGKVVAVPIYEEENESVAVLKQAASKDEEE